MPQSSRRSLLEALGTSALALLAGCTGSGGEQSRRTTTADERATRTARTTPTTGAGTDPSTADSVSAEPATDDEPTTETATAESTTGEPTAAPPAAWELAKIGQLAALSGPPGGYAETSLRADGAYAVVGTEYVNGGSYLIDLSTPANPTEVHHLSASGVRCPDVQCGAREGLYYRTQKPLGESSAGSVEIVDYGFGAGTPERPVVVGGLDAGQTHNLSVHPTEPVVYAVNYDYAPDTRGMDVWDVTDPRSPELVGEAGPPGALHDVTTDPDRELLHCAYWSGPDDNGSPDRFEGYAVLDASDPREPTVLGTYSYADGPTYSQAGLDAPGFENAHYADFDPRRGLALVGDEMVYGVPGGKHVFDIGWGEGSPADPIPIGFTRSPNASVMHSNTNDDREPELTEKFDWTGHNFDVAPHGESTFVVGGDRHEGVVLYDLTDPREPTPVDAYPTDDRDPGRVGERLRRFGPGPNAWGARYCPERGFVVASDMRTGVYTFEIAPEG
jgi:hypothetical protein